MVSVVHVLGGLLLAYVLFGLYLYFSQQAMLYYPTAQDFDACEGFRDYEKVVHNGTRFYYRNGSERVIVYYHGNAGSACDRSLLKGFFEQFGASLLFVEYAGYANDNVGPSRERILADVRNVHAYVQRHAQVTVYGQSIGAGAASYHASLGGVDALVLVGAFSRLRDVAQSTFPIYPSLLLREEYDSVRWLRAYEGRLLVLHGAEDTIIPPRFSERLYETVPAEAKEYVLIEGRGHNDVWADATFKAWLQEFLTSVAARR